MRHNIPNQPDWHARLADILGYSHPGDTIVCFSDSVKALAERAHQRMCPDKFLTFDVEGEA